MIKYIITLLLLTPSYVIAGNFELPLVQSTKNGNYCEISFDKRVVSKHDCEYEYPSYLKSYSLLSDSWTSVWVFQDAPIGNSCDAGPIRFISMDSERNIKVYSPIDYCTGKIAIENDSEQINIKIKDAMSASQVEAWKFKGKKLIKLE